MHLLKFTLCALAPLVAHAWPTAREILGNATTDYGTQIQGCCRLATTWLLPVGIAVVKNVVNVCSSCSFFFFTSPE